jgi:hypothetical protein
MKQGWTGHIGNAILVVGAFTISHTKFLKISKNFGGLLDFFVWNVAVAF